MWTTEAAGLAMCCVFWYLVTKMSEKLLVVFQRDLAYKSYIVSLLHAMSCGPYCFYQSLHFHFCTAHEFDLAFDSSDNLVLCLTYSFWGFTFVDLVYMLSNGNISNDFGILVHHVLFLCAVSLALYLRIFPTLHYVMLGHEISTIFLDLRWIGHSWSKPVLQKVSDLMFAISFLASRVFLQLWFSWIFMKTMVPAAIEAEFISPFCGGLIQCLMTGVCFLYSYWGILVFQKVRRAAGC